MPGAGQAWQSKVATGEGGRETSWFPPLMISHAPSYTSLPPPRRHLAALRCLSSSSSSSPSSSSTAAAGAASEPRSFRSAPLPPWLWWLLPAFSSSRRRHRCRGWSLVSAGLSGQCPRGYGDCDQPGRQAASRVRQAFEDREPPLEWGGVDGRSVDGEFVTECVMLVFRRSGGEVGIGVELRSRC